MLGISQYRQYLDGADPVKMITSQCLHPKKIRITDSCGNVQDMYVPCGNCIRCADSVREQWVSRMCLHSLSYKHCYFVTLTYGTYNLNEYDKHPFKDSWLETCPRESTLNYHHRLAYSPVLLRHEHLTKFLKRLRKRLGFPLTYCACGEYGKNFLRPHFHLIIWSNEVITKSDVMFAWSYDCLQVSDKVVTRYAGSNVHNYPHFRFLIGRVDFHDLVANGSLDFDAVDNLVKNNAKHAFSYVAKYVCKRDALDKRMQAHIQSAFLHFPSVPWYDEPDDMRQLLGSWDCERMRAEYEGRKPDITRTLFHPFFDEEGGVLVNVKFNNRIIPNVNKKTFVKIFAPFFVCSRSTSIGRLYYEKNFERFQEGSLDLPKFFGKSLVFPAYFTRLLRNECCPVYFRKKSLLSVSYSRDFIPSVLRLYRDFREDSSIFYSPLCSQLASPADAHKFHRDAYFRPTLLCNDGYVTYLYDPNTDMFEGYRYSRSSRTYELYDYTDRISFCDYIIDTLEKRIKDILFEVDNRALLTQFQSDLLNVPNREEIVEQFVSRREERSRIYDIQHYKFSKL